MVAHHTYSSQGLHLLQAYGWESVATDIIGIDDYDDRQDWIIKCYHADEVLPRLFKRERPGGRILVLEGQMHAEEPLMLTQFGAIAFSRDRQGTWGYSRCNSPEEFARRYRELLDIVRDLQVFSGSTGTTIRVQLPLGECDPKPL